MPFLDLFSDRADLYASARPRYPDELFRFIATIAPGTERAWDCGAGNGQAAVSLARYFALVSASDPSEQQIAHALPADRVIYSVQPAETTDFPAASFDAVCVAQALHWFDPSAFFGEVRRVLKPNGVFVAWGYSWFAVMPEVDAIFKRTILDVIEADWAPQNGLLWRGYRDIAMPLTPIAAPTFEIRESWNLYQLLAYVHTWSATRRCMARLGTAFFTRAEAALLEVWGAPETPRAVVMPLAVLAGRTDAAVMAPA